MRSTLKEARGRQKAASKERGALLKWGRMRGLSSYHEGCSVEGF